MISRLDLSPARREQHLAAESGRVLPHDVARPLVVRAIADHDLDGVVRREQRQVLPAIARFLARGRRFEVDHTRHARVDVRDVDGSAGLERHAETRVAEPREQCGAARLRRHAIGQHAAPQANSGV